MCQDVNFCGRCGAEDVELDIDETMSSSNGLVCEDCKKKLQQETRKCTKCNTAIPRERLKILPSTTVCVRCSDTKPVYGDGRYGSIVIGRSEKDKQIMRMRYE